MRFKRERIRGTTPELDAAARAMRRDATPAETILWQQLRRGWMGGYRFRRQHAIGRFILDLYCAERKLAIELDGAHHAGEEQALRDEARTAALARYGIRVLRFRNDEVLQNLDAVIKRIADELGDRGADETSDLESHVVFRDPLLAKPVPGEEPPPAS